MKKIVMLALSFSLCSAIFAQETKMDDKKMEHKMTMKKDCVMMKGGKMMMMKDGKTMTMDKDMTMSNGTMVMTDGTAKMSNGKTMMLKENQCMTMDGKMVMMKKKKPMAHKM